MSAERRRFFRITDRVGVAYRVLSQDEVDSQSSDLIRPADVFGMINNYEMEISALLLKLGDIDPLLEEVLTTINKKINCVIDHIELENRLVQQLAHKVHEVNISACGMAFLAGSDLVVGQSLSLDIVLHPSERHVFTCGKVVGTDMSEDGVNSYVRINFYNMSSNAQETLIQHIVQRQGALLREKRPFIRTS